MVFEGANLGLALRDRRPQAKCQEPKKAAAATAMSTSGGAAANYYNAEASGRKTRGQEFSRAADVVVICLDTTRRGTGSLLDKKWIMHRSDES